MKKILSFFVLTAGLVFSGRAAPSFSYETAAELQLDADLDGNGYTDLIIVDQVTGAFRVGYQSAGGAYYWAGGRSSGVVGATGVSAGRLNSANYDTLVTVGPDNNQVSLVDATNSVSPACLQVGFSLASVGPNACAVLDIGGSNNNAYADIYVASCYNGLNAYREALVRNLGGGSRSNLADVAISNRLQQVNPVVLHTNRAARLAAVEQGTLGYDYFRLMDLADGTNANLASRTYASVPATARYVYGQFVATNPCTQFLLYQPGDRFFRQNQVVELATNIFVLNSIDWRYLSNGFSRLQVISGTGSPRLLVVSTNESSAGIYTFDGLTNPVLQRAFSCEPGYHFTGAGPDAAGGWTFYSAPLGESRSLRFARWAWTGSGYTNSASGDLPRVSSYGSAGNVLQFRNEPFVTNQPLLLRVNNAGDWAGAPAFSGSPSNLAVRAETFLSVTQGLAGPVVATLGRSHALARFALANQYSNAISLYSLNPPRGDQVSEVAISPVAGTYAAAVRFSFTTTDPADRVFYRIGNTDWTRWSNSVAVPLITNATVQYYAQSVSNLDKTVIHAAAYAFTKAPADMDTKGDGIPDYVKVARGLSLTGSADADGDGFTDFEELINGTDPLSAASHPARTNHLDDQAVFNLQTTPTPWDGFWSVVTKCDTNSTVNVFNMQGGLLRAGAVATNTWPLARLTNVTIHGDTPLVALATDSHYSIITSNADKRIGREMLALVSVPALSLTNLNVPFLGGNLSNAALSWVTNASNALHQVTRGTVSNKLDMSSTLIALLCEQKIAQLLGVHGYPWWTNVTLFPNRAADLLRTNPPADVLLTVETATNGTPGFRLKTIYQSISNSLSTMPSSAGVSNLLSVLRDIYSVSGRYNNSKPATFLSPVDEVRYFLWRGTVDTNYLPLMTTAAKFPGASNAATAVLSAVSGRLYTNLSLLVRADTVSNDCRLMDGLLGDTYALEDSAGQPFGFPDGFNLLPGTQINVAGYVNPTNAHSRGHPVIEVAAVLLATLPASSDTDSGNLLVDSWERQFFGAVGAVSPFEDSDGDGYDNLVELLEGSDPTDKFSIPAAGPHTMDKPELRLAAEGAGFKLQWNWPWRYKERFNFALREADSLTGVFTDAGLMTDYDTSADQLRATVTPASGSQHFYYLTITLK